jgi:hypothetical protein
LIYESERVYEEPKPTEKLIRVRVQANEMPSPDFDKASGGLSNKALARPAMGIGELDYADSASRLIGSGKGWMPESIYSQGALLQAVDLSNLTEASQGDPVRYGYFSAMRERIQQTANKQIWRLNEAELNGVVYVEFVVANTGNVESASVEPNRSTQVESIQGIAVSIVSGSSPFLPFPPSFKESSKTIIVPIEFDSN